MAAYLTDALLESLSGDLLVTPQEISRLPAIVAPLLGWYRENARQMPWRENPTPYHVWISEIMLQQTRVEAVRGYFERFLTALPTIEALAAVPEDALLKLWEGLGYYNRARNLKKAAEVLVTDYGGKLPASYEALLTLPGIGEYTAGAIASHAFGIAVPAVDGNVYRVISRLIGSYAIINTTVAIKGAYRTLVGGLVPATSPGDFNQALMELGALICVPNGAPKCGECPVQALCAAHLGGFAEELPVRPLKKPRLVEEHTIALVLSPLGVLLRKRPPEGLLASLWEPLNVEGMRSEAEVEEMVMSLGGTVRAIIPLAESRQIFTHREWEMMGYLCECAAFGAPEGTEWTKDLANYALPSAFRAYTAILQQELEERDAKPE